MVDWNDSISTEAQFLHAGGRGFPKPVTWREKTETTPKIREGRLFFVNQDNAIQQLQHVHQNNYYRALTKSGGEWIIPICDNDFGLGKTEFSLQYIKRAAEPPQSGASEFRTVLSQAHTVLVMIGTGDLSNENMFEEKLLTLLQEKLRTKFKISPACLYRSYERTSDFLSELISEIGPVFIALDRIGAAFDIQDKTDMERRNLFLRFCSVVLQRWLLIPELFFLLLGRRSFMNLVSCRPGNVEISP